MLTFWDYVVIAVYIVGVMVLGLVFSGRQKSLKEYFLASGDMPWWAVSLSLHATALSPLSFLGAAGWVFFNDSRYILGASLLGVGTIVIAAFVWVPLWARLRMISIYEYLEQRFHPALRVLGAAFFLIQMVFWIGNGLVAASMAFSVATGVSVVTCLIAMLVLGTVYTMLGGSRAVIWTDVAQAITLGFGFVVIAFVLLQYFNWQPMEVYKIASSTISKNTGYPPTQIFSTEFSLAVEATIWALLLSRVASALMFGSQQVIVQRLLASGSKRRMYKALFGAQAVTLFFLVLVTVVAWGFVAYYQQNPQAKGLIDQADEVLPHFVAHNVPVLIRGLIMAGLLAAMMSTFDSALNSMSSVTTSDFYRRYFARNRSEKHYVASSRYFTLGWGILLLLFALWQSDHADAAVLERVGKLNALMIPPIACFFILGVFSKRCNTKGVLIGGLTALASALCFITIPGIIDKPLIDPDVIEVNWVWLDGSCTMLGLLVGYLASMLFRAPDKEKLKGLTLWAKS